MQYTVSRLSITAFSLSCVLGLGGCIGSDTYTDDQTRTRTEGMIGGALLGSLASQFSTDNAFTDTLLNSGITSAAGYVIGDEVAKRKQAYKDKEALIEGESQRTADTIAEVQKANTALEKDIKVQRQAIKQLQKQAAKDASKREELSARKQALQEQHKQAKKALKGVNNELETEQLLYKDAKQSASASDQASLAQWNKRIQALKAEKVALERNSGQLQALSDSIAL